MKKNLLFLFIGYSLNLFCQERLNLDHLASKYTLSSLEGFKKLLSIPNDANDKIGIQKNIEWTEKEFGKRGFTVSKIMTKGAPLLFAKRDFTSNGKTVLIYLQMDGQPVDPSKWDQKNPYSPVLKKKNSSGDWEAINWEKIYEYNDDWRIFARSSSDAKGPVSMFIAAIDAIDENGITPNFNIKVILDFEEEMGSPNLPDAVKKNGELLTSDVLIILDGPRHRLNKPTLTFGARGIATIQLTTYGPIVPQHSGHFGNYVPNPALRLSKILASMKDENGKVTIEGYYDGIEITPDVKKILESTPHNEKELLYLFQVAGFDKVKNTYQEAIQYPSLNIRGMGSGWINEEVRTIIPSWARAEIDVRLVKESDPERLLSLIKKHIEGLGYLVLDREPNKKERLENKKIATFTSKVSYQSFRTSLKNEYSIWLRNAIKRGFGEDPILIRMSGGSIPISPFVNTLNIPAITVPTVNRDNNQHSPNENIRLGNYREGVKTILSILSEKI